MREAHPRDNSTPPPPADKATAARREKGTERAATRAEQPWGACIGAPPNHPPDVLLWTPNPHAGVGGQNDGTGAAGFASQYNPEHTSSHHK